MTRATITLRPREPPLTPCGIVARGAGLLRLAAATRRRLNAGAELLAAAGEGWLVVLGSVDDLPWADGCVYVGREGSLLMPTTRMTSQPADLAAGALRGGGENGLLVLLDDAVLRGPMPVRVANGARLDELA